MSDIPKFGPASPKQRLILQDVTTDVLLVGGGAGSGKSTVCLMKNLDSIHDPHFRCAILRRSAPQLKRQGGLIDESWTFYQPFTGKYNKQAMVWRFPSNASIAFNFIASDKDLGGWQGSQMVRILIDEAADEWTEHQVLFLLTRLRSAKCKTHPQLIMTCNPDKNSFLYEWVKFSLDEDGIPKQGTENIIKWFVVIDNKPRWADSPEECYEKYGVERGMIYAKDMSEERVAELSDDDKKKLFIPKSFRFIPATIYDNPYLLPPKNDSYLANLLGQPRVNQQKFLFGSWTAKAEGEGYFRREWVKYVDRVPTEHIVKTVRAWDFAATEKSEVNNDPDWTAGVKISRDKFGMYYIEDVYRCRKLTHGVLQDVIRIAHEDGIDDVEVVIPRDSGAGGKAANMFIVRELSEQNIVSRSVQVSGHSGKLHRFLPFAAMAEAGNVTLVKGDWNEDYLLELENFIPNARDRHDDQVDATSDGFNVISKSLQIPTFLMPNLSASSIKQRMS